jgi:hypothetical protein
LPGPVVSIKEGLGSGLEVSPNQLSRGAACWTNGCQKRGCKWWSTVPGVRLTLGLVLTFTGTVCVTGPLVSLFICKMDF